MSSTVEGGGKRRWAMGLTKLNFILRLHKTTILNLGEMGIHNASISANVRLVCGRHPLIDRSIRMGV
jgi:hypothetical protein